MAASEDSSALYPFFILSMLAIPLVPHTFFKLLNTITRKAKTIHCQCSLCSHSRKCRKSIFKRISTISTCSNVAFLLLWAFVVIIVYHITHTSYEIQAFEPFSILGLDPGASDSEIKKAYRKLSILYHPDKNPEPEAHNYFVSFISKAYQALTDPVSRENYQKYGHPDGRQGFRMGIALPYFLMNSYGSSGGVVLLGIVGICIILPLTIAVAYLSWSSKYSGNYVMYQTLVTYFQSMKPSLAPSKVWEIFIKSAEFRKIPVRKRDSEPIQNLFGMVRRELNMESKKDQSLFWKQDPGLVKMALLLHTQLTRQSHCLYSPLRSDLKRMLELAPLLLEHLVAIAVIPRPPIGRGLLRPAIGAIELSQNIVQKVQTFQELRDMSMQERSQLLSQAAGFSLTQVHDIEIVLESLPSITLEVSLKTEGEEEIQEGDFTTMYAWINLKRGNNLKSSLPHSPYYPFYKEENYYLILADSATNEVWISQKVNFMDEDSAVRSAKKLIARMKELLGATDQEISEAVKFVAEKVKNGSRQVIGKLLAPGEGTYNLTAYCLCDSWIGCDVKTDIKVEVFKKNRDIKANESTSIEQEIEEVDEDYDSEYSDDDDENEKKMIQ
ncbi:dnaJ protein ERDJ2-like isoform X2 [Asparagus officinalis]|uniref:dnaJ protein ERDJ2-like isoform X2 n=1 Tax=Asparagus officinalis TaxID=4686 RepID=UPI00098DEAC7|nr:dnaJ protein ERDJ2-like isoform X2 [Asparagus officinalis]